MNVIKENDFIYLVLDERRRWLIQIKKGESFHTHKGIIEHDDIIDKPYGTCIFSKPYEQQGYKFYILKPLPSDFILHMGRKTQIIYPKDAGIILLHTGIGPGSIVVEAGCGSGALTCILGNYVRPNGHVYSYDIREKSLKQATKNIKKANLEQYVSINYGNIIEDGINHEDVDAIVLDMPTPWAAIEKVKKFLRLSGSIVSFSPTIEQVKKTTFELQKNDFFEIITVELLMRTMQIKINASRPDTRMVGHSGYLTFARKIENKKNPYRCVKPKKNEYVNLKGMPLRNNEDDD